MDSADLIRTQLERAGVSASDEAVARVDAIARASVPRRLPELSTEPQLVRVVQRWEERR